MRCALTTMPDCWAWRKYLGETHPRDGVGGEQVAQDFAGADGGELIDITDEQQMRSFGDGLDELVGQDDVHHRGLVDHD